MNPGTANWRRTKAAVLALAAVAALVTVSLFLWKSTGDQSGEKASSGGAEPSAATPPATALPDGPLQVLGV